MELGPKYQMAIQRQTDIEILRRMTLELCGVLYVITRQRVLDNYRAMCKRKADTYWEYDRGSLEFCKGFLEGRGPEGGATQFVACGSMIVWPEEMFGEMIDESKVAP